MLEDFNQEIADKEERLIYQASRRGAYGLVIEAPDIMTIKTYDNSFTTKQRVRICQTKQEFEDAKKEIASCFNIEIPDKLKDIAKDSNFTEFREKAKSELVRTSVY